MRLCISTVIGRGTDRGQTLQQLFDLFGRFGHLFQRIVNVLPNAEFTALNVVGLCGLHVGRAQAKTTALHRFEDANFFDLISSRDAGAVAEDNLAVRLNRRL